MHSHIKRSALKFRMENRGKSVILQTIAGADKSDSPMPGASDFSNQADKKLVGTCSWASDFLNFCICTENESTIFCRIRTFFF